MHHYILEGHEPRAVDLMTWARWFEADDEQRVVQQTTVGEATVSTVFMGMDMGALRSGNHAPLLFESVVFGGVHNGEEVRYATWEDAEAGHAAIVARLKEQWSL